jgi:anti-anti-sigma factor
MEAAMARRDSARDGFGCGVVVEYDVDLVVIRLVGEHDLSTVIPLSETIARASALNDVDVVVDLSAVQFLSAATIGVVVRALESLRLRSRSLMLRSPSTRARRVLDLCGLAYQDTPSRPAGALGTWAVRPATDQVERCEDRVVEPSSSTTTDRPAEHRTTVGEIVDPAPSR